MDRNTRSNARGPNTLIKTGVDQAPLSAMQGKLIEAAALTHLATGLTIGVHTGNGDAANEQLKILDAKGVGPSARIWIHAQNEKDWNQYLDRELTTKRYDRWD